MKQQFIEDLGQFIAYCNDFYNLDTGIYPLATYEQISDAVIQYIKSDRPHVCDFDSLDRELVRKILQPEYSLI